MKLVVFLLFMLTVVIDGYSQIENNSEKFERVKISPEFPGGMSGFYGTYIIKNLRYPGDAVKADIQGKVMVQFVIEETGEIRDNSVKVVESVHPSLDSEAIRLIKGSPRWKPGRVSKRGEAKKVRMILPIDFRLN